MNIRVKIIRCSVHAYKTYDIVGSYGRIVKVYRSSGRFGVQIDGKSNPHSEDGTFWLDKSDFEVIKKRGE